MEGDGTGWDARYKELESKPAGGSSSVSLAPSFAPAFGEASTLPVLVTLRSACDSFCVVFGVCSRKAPDSQLCRWMQEAAYLLVACQQKQGCDLWRYVHYGSTAQASMERKERHESAKSLEQWL